MAKCQVILVLRQNVQVSISGGLCGILFCNQSDIFWQFTVSVANQDWALLFYSYVITFQIPDNGTLLLTLEPYSTREAAQKLSCCRRHIRLLYSSKAFCLCRNWYWPTGSWGYCDHRVFQGYSSCLTTHFSISFLEGLLLIFHQPSSLTIISWLARAVSALRISL